MRLSEWLSKNEIRRGEFARRVGVSAPHITGLCKGDFWPGRDVAAAIMRETGGEVRPEDFLARGQGAA